jgi:hypothetical protein
MLVFLQIKSQFLFVKFFRKAVIAVRFSGNSSL